MSHPDKRKDPPFSPGDVGAEECVEKTGNRPWKKQKQGDQLGGEPLPRLPPTTRKYLPPVITTSITVNFMMQITSLSGWEAYTGMEKGASKPSSSCGFLWPPGVSTLTVTQWGLL